MSPLQDGYFSRVRKQCLTPSLMSPLQDGYFSRVRKQCLDDGPPDFGGALVWRARLEAGQAEKYGYEPGRASWYFGENRVFLVFTISKGHVVWTASCPIMLFEVALVDTG